MGATSESNETKKKSSSASPPHYLITRFAIKPEGELAGFVRPNSKESLLFLDAEWLQKRLSIFTEWCVPSVAAQTIRFDKWVILVSEEVDSNLRKALIAATPDYSQILSVPRSESFLKTLDAYFAEIGTNFISTRLDADDVLSRDFRKTVGKKIKAGKVLNLKHGYQYFVETGILVHKFLASNPFISYWSTSGENVFQLGIHSQAGRRVGVHEALTVKPMYLKIAHSSNTAHNGFGGIPVLGYQRAAKLFGLSVKFKRPKLSSVVTNLRGFLGSTYDRAFIGLKSRKG